MKRRSTIQKRLDESAGVEGEMFLEAYTAMQRAIRPDAGGKEFEMLNNASRVVGAIAVPKAMKEAFVLELRLRSQLVFEHQAGMKVPDYIAHRQKQARNKR
jgi:hypothetical protein